MGSTAELSYRDYLEALYEMAEEGIPTQQARLAEWLGVSPASVSEAVKRLTDRGMLTHRDRRLLAFTEEGRRMAEVFVRRHRLAERFLVEVIGLPWHLSHEEATRWGPAISDQVEDRLVEILGDPPTCVHGNPIPGSKNPVDQKDLVSLQSAPMGDRLRLERLTEDLELDLSVMRFFEESKLVPGAELRIVSQAPDGTLTLEISGNRVALGPHLADNIWVRPLG
jgi:DtxR family transcriptional regulator, Mn-dependent transcriptional regulator